MKAKRKRGKDGSRVRGPASRLSFKAAAKPDLEPRMYTPVIVHEKRRQLTPKEAQQLTYDTFNAIHCRICLNDGLSPNVDVTEIREKILGIIATNGWERTLQVLASCARLFAEVPTPLPALPDYIGKALHKFAGNVDAASVELRHVDREASKGHEI